MTNVCQSAILQLYHLRQFGEDIMKFEKKLFDFPIFSTLGAESCRRLEEEGKVINRSFDVQESVTGRAVYLVLSGTCAVYSADSSHPVLLRYLHTGDIFGVATVFSEKETISKIEARSRLTLATVSRDVIRELCRENEQFLDAYLAYLSDRIAFLNGKISTIAAGNADRRLASWILSNVDRDSDELVLSVSISDLARLLDLGRASLYRAFDELTRRGHIKKIGNHIVILDKAALKNDTDI